MGTLSLAVPSAYLGEMPNTHITHDTVVCSHLSRYHLPCLYNVPLIANKDPTLVHL